jgi:hypothetical protein
LLARIGDAFREARLENFADLDKKPLAADNALEVRARGPQLDRCAVEGKTGSARELDDRPTLLRNPWIVAARPETLREPFPTNFWMLVRGGNELHAQ